LRADAREQQAEQPGQHLADGRVQAPMIPASLAFCNWMNTHS
jgi:hypothetical protein